MRKTARIAATFLTGAMAIGTSLIAASAADAAGQPKGPAMKATGDITWSNNKTQWEGTFDAHADYAGRAAKGFFERVGVDGAGEGRVTRVEIDEFRAFDDATVCFGGVVAEDTAAGGGDRHYIVVKDGGVDGTDQIATHRASNPSGGQTWSCDDLAASWDVTDGNLVIHEGGIDGGVEAA